MLQEELTGTTEEKIIKVLSLFTETPIDQITLDFNLKNDINVDPDYFNQMISDLLNSEFGVSTEPEDINNFNTAQDIVNKINESQ